MAESQELKILLKIQADVADLQQVNAGLGETKSRLDDAGQAGGLFKESFAIGAGVEIVHRLTDALAEIPARIHDAIASGVEFNAKLQDIQTSMAGVLRLTQSEQFGSFAQAKAAAGDYIEVIKQSANKVGLTYESMLETVTETQAKLKAAGVTGINEVIQSSLLLTQAMRAVGVGAQNASRDVGDLLQGNAKTQGGRALAAALSLSTEELQKLIQTAVQSGDFVGFLTQHFSALGDAITDSSQNADASFNRLKNLITDLESEAAKPIMEPLTKGINDAASSDKIENFKILARFIGDVGAAALSAAAEVIKLGTAIEQLGAGYSKITGILRTISQITPTGLLFHDFVADTFDKSKKSVEDEAAAAKQAATNVGESFKQTTEAAEGTISQASAKQSASLEKANAGARLLLATLSSDGPTVAAGRAQAAYDKYIEEVKKAGPITSKELDTAFEIYGAVQKKTLAEIEHRNAAAGSRAQAEAERDAHRDIVALLTQESALLQATKQKQQLVEQDPFLSADQKNSALQQLIPQQIDLINQKIAQGRAAIAQTALDPAQLARANAALRNSEVQVALLGQKLKILSLGGTLRADLVSWASQFGTTAHQIGTAITSTIGTAVSGVSNAITGAIFHTQSWGQAFAQVAQQIIGSLINIVIQWAAQQAVMAALNAVFKQSATASTNAAAAESAAAWAPAATAASIASYGAADLAGTAALAAAMGVGQGIVTGLSAAGSAGFAKGGYTGDGNPGGIAGPAHFGEFVFSALATKRAGIKNLEAAHGAFTRPSYESGGYVSTGGGAGNRGGGALKQTLIFVSDIKEAIREHQKSSDGIKHIINVVAGNRVQLGLAG